VGEVLRFGKNQTNNRGFPSGCGFGRDGGTPKGVGKDSSFLGGGKTLLKWRDKEKAIWPTDILCMQEHVDF